MCWALTIRVDCKEPNNSGPTWEPQRESTMRGVPLLVFFTVCQFLFLVAINWRSTEKSNGRGLMAASLDKFPSSKMQCQDVSNNNATIHSAKSVLVPGYPGSGNDLVRNIVKHLTGLEGRDIYLDVHCAPQTNTATCKTHWPVFRRHPPADLKENFHSSVLLLIRNPSRSLASHFNYEFESKNNLTDHSQQAPEADWVLWRDENFGRQIRLWKKVITWWMTSDVYHVQTVIPYEKLVDDTTGPALTQAIADQLNTAGFSVASDTACQWHWCVKQRATVKRAPHTYQPGFTAHQTGVMLKLIQQLIDEYSNHPMLSRALNEYKADITSHL